MIEPQKDYDYQIVDLGTHQELTSNTLQGLVAGVVYLTNNSLKPNYDGCNTIGNTYIIPSFKHTEELSTEHQKEIKEVSNVIEDKDKEIIDLLAVIETQKKDIKSVNDTKRTQATQITKLKKKITSLEGGDSVKDVVKDVVKDTKK